MNDLGGRSGELLVFVSIVAAGGVSAGARSLGLVPSTASRMLTRLEKRVGARLIVREGRVFRLTREGASCYTSAKRILADMDELEQALGDCIRPRGLLRVSASVAFGRLYVLPLLEAFRARYPEVTVQVVLTDRIVDIDAGEADLAVRVRVGPLPDSDLKVRRLMASPRILVAAPTYLKRAGTPKHPSELEAYTCLRLRTSDRDAPWLFLDHHAPLEISPHGSIVVDSGESLVQLAIAGFGIAQVGRFHVADQLASGALVAVLDDYRSPECEIIQAVFAGRTSAPGRVRVFVDFLAENLRRREVRPAA